MCGPPTAHNRYMPPCMGQVESIAPISCHMIWNRIPTCSAICLVCECLGAALICREVETLLTQTRSEISWHSSARCTRLDSTLHLRAESKRRCSDLLQPATEERWIRGESQLCSSPASALQLQTSSIRVSSQLFWAVTLCILVVAGLFWDVSETSALSRLQSRDEQRVLSLLSPLGQLYYESHDAESFPNPSLNAVLQPMILQYRLRDTFEVLKRKLIQTILHTRVLQIFKSVLVWWREY